MTEGLMAAALLLLCICALLLCVAAGVGVTCLWLRQRRGERGERVSSATKEELDKQWENLWNYDGSPQSIERGSEE